MDKPTMKRSAAADLIDKIRVAATMSDATAALFVIQRHLEEAGLPALVKCTGEAHGNPHIDNCAVCMPRWGLIGERVEVR